MPVMLACWANATRKGCGWGSSHSFCCHAEALPAGGNTCADGVHTSCRGQLRRQRKWWRRRERSKGPKEVEGWLLDSHLSLRPTLVVNPGKTPKNNARVLSKERERETSAPRVHFVLCFQVHRTFLLLPDLARVCLPSSFPAAQLQQHTTRGPPSGSRQSSRHNATAPCLATLTTCPCAAAAGLRVSRLCACTHM